MQVPESIIALAGILNTGCTCDQMCEYGNVLSRETAQSVREQVVARVVDQPLSLEGDPAGD